MSKYGWISETTESYLNHAVRERVLRWEALKTHWYPGKHATTELENELLDYLVNFQNNPGHNDSRLMGLVRRIKQDRGLVQVMDQGQPFTQQQLERSRRHKYRSSYWLRQAIWSFAHQRVESMPGMRPQSLKGHQAMLKKARNMKKFMQEVQRRYELVDRSFGGQVVRANGKVVRVSK